MKIRFIALFLAVMMACLLPAGALAVQGAEQTAPIAGASGVQLDPGAGNAGISLQPGATPPAVGMSTDALLAALGLSQGQNVTLEAVLNCPLLSGNVYLRDGALHIINNGPDMTAITPAEMWEQMLAIFGARGGVPAPESALKKDPQTVTMADVKDLASALASVLLYDARGGYIDALRLGSQHYWTAGYLNRVLTTYMSREIALLLLSLDECHSYFEKLLNDILNSTQSPLPPVRQGGLSGGGCGAGDAAVALGFNPALRPEQIEMGLSGVTNSAWVNGYIDSSQTASLRRYAATLAKGECAPPSNENLAAMAAARTGILGLGAQLGLTKVKEVTVQARGETPTLDVTDEWCMENCDDARCSSRPCCSN